MSSASLRPISPGPGPRHVLAQPVARSDVMSSASLRPINLGPGPRHVLAQPLALRVAAPALDVDDRFPSRFKQAPALALRRRVPVALSTAVRRHAVSLRWLVPLLVLAAALHGWNLHHSPGPDDDEGTYVSQAWSFAQHGELSHYTYWYDHPPLGWLFLAVWNAATGVTARGGSLFYAGRDAMLAVHLVSCAAMFVLARRLGLARWAAALAVLLFTVSPLGMAWQRLTLLDNIGTPLLLIGWALVLSPRRRLVAYAAAGMAVAGAVLVKETNALFLPAIAGQLWWAARGPNRRFAAAVFGGIFAGCVGLYPLYAILKSELLPGPGHVSLVGALIWQLFQRAGSGSLFDPASALRLAIADWLHRDGPLLEGAAASAPLVVWRHRRAAPLAVTVVVLCLMPLRGGYLPAPYPINLVWPCALLLALGVHAVMAPLLASRRPVARVLAGLALALAVLPVAGRALAADRPYLTRDDDREYRQAEAWLHGHLGPDDVILVDNTLWIDLVQHGYSRNKVIWFYKFDLDPAVMSAHPGGWRAVQYVAASSIVGAADASLPDTKASVDHGRLVVEFGDIRIYRVM